MTRAIAPPSQTTRQRQAALQDATRKRLAKAAIRRAIRDRELTLEQIAEQRPVELARLTLFDLLLLLPGVAQPRLEKINRLAIKNKVNLARTVGEASAATMAWLVRNVPKVHSHHSHAIVPVLPEPASGPASASWPCHSAIGAYATAEGACRRVVLITDDDCFPVLVDRGESDERVIERFEGRVGLLQVAAVAQGYLEEARALRRPVVAA